MKRGAAVWCGLLLAAGLFGPAHARAADAAGQLATDVDRVTERLKDLEARLQLVERQYVEKPKLIGITSFEQKLGEGQIFFALGEGSKDTKNFERAAILLFDLVESPDFRNRSGYDEAAFTLAESLFQLRFRYAARTYYRLVAERRNPRFQERSIVRLIELAGLLDNFEGLDEYYRRYEQIARGNIQPAVRYARGKLLLRADRLDESEAELSQVPATDHYSSRALYLRGVILMRHKKTEQAIALFTKSAATPASAAEDAEVRDLANMARGRLYYELGMLAESADAYQDIGTESVHFSEMLYEVSWTFVKRGQNFKDDPERANAEFGKALQALDLLLISNTSKKLESEVRILRGNLLSRLDRLEESETAFEDVVSEYSPTLKQLEQMMAEPSNSERVLEELMRADRAAVTVDSVLPTLARQWAAGDESVRDAVRVYADIAEAGDQVNETKELADKLLKVIDAPNRLDLFPALQEGRARALSLENSLLAALGSTADMDARILGRGADGPPGEQYRTARLTRLDLQRKLVAMPGTEADMATRMKRFRERLAALEKRVFKQQLDIDRVESTIAAIDATVRERKASGTMPPSEEEYWHSELVQMAGALEQMRSLETDLKTAIRSEKDQLTLAGAAGSQESAIRAQYREAVTREAGLAADLMPHAATDLRAMVPVVSKARDNALALLGRMDQFNQALHQQVDGQASEIRGVVLLERSRLEEYERMVGAYQGDAREMASVLTQIALKGVRDQFYDVVLRADVGLIDLAWESKQERTEEVSRLVRKQKADMLALDREFEEVLRDIE